MRWRHLPSHGWSSVLPAFVHIRFHLLVTKAHLARRNPSSRALYSSRDRTQSAASAAEFQSAVLMAPTRLRTISVTVDFPLPLSYRYIISQHLLWWPIKTSRVSLYAQCIHSLTWPCKAPPQTASGHTTTHSRICRPNSGHNKIKICRPPVAVGLWCQA